MFDKTVPGSSPRSAAPPKRRRELEEERIALRCHRRELQLLDSFVVSGEFESRSELMREALRAFLRARAAPSASPIPPRNPSTLVETIVRLRAEEVEQLAAYAELLGNGQPLADLLATLVRRGEVEAKVSELVERHRGALREAKVRRERIGGLEESARELERKGVVGR
ncbi:MAG: ribbon-helix-helix domain-containing protein [Candidatus Lutacidiplasmatales archaeon]